MRMLNLKPQRLTEEQRRAYIASFDGETAQALGMFAKPEERIVGLTTLYLDKPRRAFLINVLTGDPGDRGKGARTETRIVLYKHLFEDLGFESAHCSTLAHNADNMRSMERRGWKLQRISHRPSVADGSMLEVREYKLDRDTWRKIGG